MSRLLPLSCRTPCLVLQHMSSDGLTKGGPSTKKIEGHFFVFQNKVISKKKVITLEEPRLSVPKQSDL